MNWKLIKEKYPKAWEKFLSQFHKVMDMPIYVIGDDGTHLYVEYGLEYIPRFLYDFFDEQGMVMLIDCNPEDRFYGYLLNIKCCFIVDSDTDYYKTRTEAEEAAFTKAFKILEEKL